MKLKTPLAAEELEPEPKEITLMVLSCLTGVKLFGVNDSNDQRAATINATNYENTCLLPGGSEEEEEEEEEEWLFVAIFQCLVSSFHIHRFVRRHLY
jgi:hypothetical protein